MLLLLMVAEVHFLCFTVIRDEKNDAETSRKNACL